MIQTYRKLILGATFFGLSKLLCEGDDCLLLERGTLIGSEFVDSLNEWDGTSVCLQSEFGKRFEADLKRHGLLSAKREVYPAPALFLFCRQLEQAAPNVVFNAETVEIQPNEQGFLVTYISGQGKNTVQVTEIVDTTSQGVLHDGIRQTNATKSLNAVVQLSDPPPVGEVVTNHAAGLTVFQLPVDLDESYVSAQQKMHQVWQQQCGDHKLVFIANTFAYRMPPTKVEIMPRFVWVPSCGFGHLIDAIEGGQQR